MIAMANQVTKKERNVLIAKAADLLAQGFERIHAAAVLSRTEGVPMARARHAVREALRRRNR